MPKIENISLMLRKIEYQTAIKTKETFIIPLADYNNAVTTSRMFRLWEINLKGLKVLSSLKIRTKPKFAEAKPWSIKAVTTIKKSN